MESLDKPPGTLRGKLCLGHDEKHTGKNTKVLKFKEDSPTLTQNNSGDLILNHGIKKSTLKPTLNDSSSKQLGINTRRVSANETGTFGKSMDGVNAEKLRNPLPSGTSSTLPDIKNFYHS